MEIGPDELAVLERRRDELLLALGRTGDFRRGSLNETMRKCGKPNCACAAPDHPGHGPQYNLTWHEGGKTRTEHLKPGPELDRARREVAEYRRFRELVAELTEVSDAICRARPDEPGSSAGQASSGSEGEKRGSGQGSRPRRLPR